MVPAIVWFRGWTHPYFFVWSEWWWKRMDGVLIVVSYSLMGLTCHPLLHLFFFLASAMSTCLSAIATPPHRATIPTWWAHLSGKGTSVVRPSVTELCPAPALALQRQSHAPMLAVGHLRWSRTPRHRLRLRPSPSLSHSASSCKRTDEDDIPSVL